MLTCREASELVSKSLAVRLSIQEKVLLWLHNLYCVPCRRFAEQAVLISKVMLQIPECTAKENNDFTLSPEACKRIKAALKKAC